MEILQTIRYKASNLFNKVMKKVLLCPAELSFDAMFDAGWGTYKNAYHSKPRRAHAVDLVDNFIFYKIPQYISRLWVVPLSRFHNWRNIRSIANSRTLRLESITILNSDGEHSGFDGILVADNGRQVGFDVFVYPPYEDYDQHWPPNPDDPMDVRLGYGKGPMIRARQYDSMVFLDVHCGTLSNEMLESIVLAWFQDLVDMRYRNWSAVSGELPEVNLDDVVWESYSEKGYFG